MICLNRWPIAQIIICLGCFTLGESSIGCRGVLSSHVDNNQPPVARDDLAQTDQNVPVDINVLANDEDPENNSISVIGVTDPAHGKVSNKGTMVVYTPAADYVGEDGFSYMVADHFGAQATAHVQVKVLTSLTPGTITAVWANNGEDKVTRDDLRSTRGSVKNSVWDGKKVTIFGAKNEVVSFNVILEAGHNAAANVRVKLNSLTTASGTKISSTATSGNGVFNWASRPIELFYVEYLQIIGLSVLAYENYYDERHVPERLRRPYTGNGEANAQTGWNDRPDHDKYYPDIAVPLELVGPFQINSQSNQSIWVDIYIPKTAVTDIYHGDIEVEENGKLTNRIPVELTVKKFTLPDKPTLKTMLYIGYEDINTRYLGKDFGTPTAGTPQADASRRIIDRHFMMAHRHKISLIDGNHGPEAWTQDAPRPRWETYLNGSLFTTAKGYNGPGVNTGQDIFAVGVYGSWSWKNDGESEMQTHSDNWVNWFDANAPGAEYFLFLFDEPHEDTLYDQIEQWSTWLNNNPGVGKKLFSFSTVAMPFASSRMPALDIPCSAAGLGVPAQWESAVQTYQGAGKRAWMYGGFRPVSGTMNTEDDGVAMRQLAWAQYKKKIQRWFIWESTYYNNFQCEDASGGQTDVFRQARTFGCDTGADPVLGRKGTNYNNGDGVLFYPGTDKFYPYPSASKPINVEGPFASLRLKHWRRGIQDADYLALAQAVNKGAVDNIIKRMVPKVLWEVGVDNQNEPTYVHANISWSTNPDVWEQARLELADIIEGKK